MPTHRRPIGRPGRYAEFEAFEAALPGVMTKRPEYCRGIGLFRGARDYTVWVKIRCPKGAVIGGRYITAGKATEIKLGRRASFDWPDMIAERDRLQSLADRGLPLEAAEVPTFATHAEDWLDRKRNVHRSFASTIGTVKSALNPTFGRKPLNAIAVGDINRWIGLQSVNRKPGTVLRQFSVLRAILNDAVRNGLIERNPADAADKIRGIEPRQRFVTEAEWKTIVATAENIEAAQNTRREQTPHRIRGWLRHYVVWAYHSGMRRAEILALTWDNVRVIDASHTVVEVLNSKNGKSRYVSCTAEMRSIIDALRDLPRIDEDTRLFPVSLMTLKRGLSALWKATGLPDIRLHDLRRSHATILISKGVDVRTVAGRLGHTGTAMLAKHYAVDRGDKEAAAAFG